MNKKEIYINLIDIIYQKAFSSSKLEERLPYIDILGELRDLKIKEILKAQ